MCPYQGNVPLQQPIPNLSERLHLFYTAGEWMRGIVLDSSFGKQPELMGL